MTDKTGGPARYEIKHISDLLAIPTDKMDEVLADIKDWHSTTQTIMPLIRAGIVGNLGMTWIDDGKPGISDVIINGQSVADAMLSERNKGE